MLFVHYLLDAPETATRRAELRAAHREYLAREDERFFAAGPLWNDDFTATAGSILIMEWPNRRAAADWLRDEPFTRNDVYGYINVKGFLNLWPKEGRPAAKHKLFAYFNLNGDAADGPRAAFRQAHLDYLAATSGNVFAAGPMFDDSDATEMEDRIGSLYIVDYPDRAAADAWFAEEPFNKNGVYADRWTRAYENLWPKETNET